MLSSDHQVSSIAAAARRHLHSIEPTASTVLIDGVSDLVVRLFSGRHPDYQKADLQYHDLDHTVLATQCFIELVEGLGRHGHYPRFTSRQFSLGYAAILLHDSGYLKAQGDLLGTGAKLTTTHVERSCGLIEKELPALGCRTEEIEGIKSAIRCTGVTSQISQIKFRSEVERLTGCMVATADYLGQMADPDYPDKLPQLFAEFEESNDFIHVPADKRMFRSAKELMAKTSGFWNFFALPKLDKEYEGIYRVLAQADGRNLYLESVNANLARIAALAAE